jgi:hypothetical protein
MNLFHFSSSYIITSIKYSIHPISLIIYIFKITHFLLNQTTTDY